MKAEMKTAGDFGKFEEYEVIESSPLPEYVAINIMKEIAKKYGIEL